MKSSFLVLLVSSLLIARAHALVISEVLSNPTGDDSGREWIELYNDSEEDIDLSTLAVSIKGGNPITTTPLQGGTALPKGGYAIIGSTVSGQTRFLTDYPSYAGVLFKSSISLVNSGTTSIDIRLNGSSVATLPSYVAAKEGTSLSFVGGEYVAGTPSPGSPNTPSDSPTDVSTSTTLTTSSQTTVAQLAPPSSDVTIYLPEEKVAVAGAVSEYAVFSTTRAGKPIRDLRYSWAFGDGGQSTGSSTRYTYAYAGRYVVQVEATSDSVVGIARMIVRVVSPDLEISSVGSGKYGTYIDVHNPNTYPLDLSQWGFSIDGAFFPFPKNTMILPEETTRFSGIAMGFASTTVSTSSVVRMLFPTLEEVVRYTPRATTEVSALAVASSAPMVAVIKQAASPTLKKYQSPLPKPTVVLGTSTESSEVNTSSMPASSLRAQKDTRLLSWLKAFLWK